MLPLSKSLEKLEKHKERPENGVWFTFISYYEIWGFDTSQAIYSHNHYLPNCCFSSVQSLSHIQLLATPWTAAWKASPSISNSQSLLKLMSIESVMPSNHLILCHPLLLLPSIFHSIRVFSNESVLPIRWPKYLSFSFSISPCNEYSGLISFRMDWLDLHVIQGTIKSLHQHHSSKESVLGEELRWQRERTGRPLSPLQIHQKNIEHWANFTK